MVGTPLSRTATALIFAVIAPLTLAGDALAQSPTPATAPLTQAVGQVTDAAEQNVAEVVELPGEVLAPAPTAAPGAAQPAATPESGPRSAARATRQRSTSTPTRAPAAAPPRANPARSARRGNPRRSRGARRERPRARAAPATTASRARPRPAARPRPPEPARPLRFTDFVESIPTWIKAVLVLLSAVLALALVSLLRSRRDLAAALARAHHDEVTGLPNRAAVEEALTRMTAQAGRNRTWLGLLMLDIDHFKSVNDDHGHQKGDEVLAAVGALARSQIRGGDFVGRYGGEELILLLPETDLAGAERLAEKLRLALRQADVGGLGRPVTASLGVSAGLGDQNTLRELVTTADAALYRAKANGRDRIEIMGGFAAPVAA